MKKKMEINTNKIVAGEVVKIEADTRAEAAEKIKDLRKRAAEQGLLEEPGGMIHNVKKDFLDPGIFVAELTFNEKQ